MMKRRFGRRLYWRAYYWFGMTVYPRWKRAVAWAKARPPWVWVEERRRRRQYREATVLLAEGTARAYAALCRALEAADAEYKRAYTAALDEYARHSEAARAEYRKRKEAARK